MCPLRPGQRGFLASLARLKGAQDFPHSKVEVLLPCSGCPSTRSPHGTLLPTGQWPRTKAESHPDFCFLLLMPLLVTAGQASGESLLLSNPKVPQCSSAENQLLQGTVAPMNRPVQLLAKGRGGDVRTATLDGSPTSDCPNSGDRSSRLMQRMPNMTGASQMPPSLSISLGSDPVPAKPHPGSSGETSPP